MTRLASALAALLLAAAPALVGAQSSAPTLTGTISATGASQPLLCPGMSTAAVALKGAAAGITVVPQATSDAQSDVLNGSAVWSTVGTVGGGSIPYAGSQVSYTGNFATTGITAFRINVTAYGSGSPTYTLACSAAIGGLTITPSGTQNVAVTSPVGQTAAAASVSVVQASNGPGTTAATAAHTNVTVGGADIDPRVISFVSAQPVTGTFFQATQPVSCASGATCPVNATLQGTSPVSLAALPPLAAGTAVIGSTGTTSVPNVGQLVDGTTPSQKAAVGAGGALKVDNSGVSQPVAFANNPCINSIPTEVAISTASATTVQLVAISGSTRIYVCQMDFMAGGTTNVTLEYGTGSGCGTGTTALTGPYPLVANTGLVKGSGAGVVGITPAAQALCIVNSAAVQLSGSLMYVQV